MLGRRSFVSMLGLAPVAATIKPAQVAVEETVSVAWKEVGVMTNAIAGDNGPMILKDKLSERARSASQGYKRAKWEIDNGFYMPENRFYQKCPNIESRKATSPAIKMILQDEFERDRELTRLMLERKKAVAKALAPPWIQSLFQNWGPRDLY